MSFPAAQPDSLAIDDKDADSRTENVGLSTYAAPHGTPDPAVLRRATLKLDFICTSSHLAPSESSHVEQVSAQSCVRCILQLLYSHPGQTFFYLVRHVTRAHPNVL
jgi:hypothetical protein